MASGVRALNRCVQGSSTCEEDGRRHLQRCLSGLFSAARVWHTQAWRFGGMTHRHELRRVMVAVLPCYHRRQGTHTGVVQ